MWSVTVELLIKLDDVGVRRVPRILITSSIKAHEELGPGLLLLGLRSAIRLCI